MSDAPALPRSGNLSVTLATWVFLLDDAGHRPASAAVQAACDALRQNPGPDADALGGALVAAVKQAVGEASSPDALAEALRALFGAEHIDTSVAADRADRLKAARAYEFSTSLPWLAQIIDRFPDGAVGAHWVLIERVTDVVTCMDPYPWDDLDEEYTLPVVEFMVKWELAGTPAIRWSSGPAASAT